MGSVRSRLSGTITIAVLAAALPAGAVITRLYPLADVIAGADTIVVTRVTGREARRQTVDLKVTEPLKGKPPVPTFPVRLPGADDRTQVPILFQRLKPGRTVILFSKARRFTLGYVEGTWFRLAEPPRPGTQPWQFVHLEIYLRRTYHGTSAEMRRTVAGVLAGRAKAPEPEARVKPGYGT